MELFVEAVGDAEVQEASGADAGCGPLVGSDRASGTGAFRSLADGIETCGWSIRAG